MVNLRSQFETQAVIALVNRIVELRDLRDHKGIHSDKSTDGVPIAFDLYGNLGNLVFLSDGKAYGEAWIASSLSSKYDLSDYFKKIGVTPVELSATEYGTLFWQHPDAPDYATAFEPRYRTPKKKSHDSEYLLINFLEKSLTEMRISEGTLYLLTERVPCAHCTDVIKRFQTDFPLVTINVLYLLNTQIRVQGEERVRTAANFLEETIGTGINLLHTEYTNGILTTTPCIRRAL